VLDEHGVGSGGLRVVATSAARDASNGADLVAAVTDVLGVAPDIITGQDEAKLTFAGAVANLDAEVPACVIDIGGGSTEFAVGGTAVDAVVSVDVGSVRLTEGYLTSDPPAPEELANALGVVHDHLDDALRAVPAIEDVATLVGVAGTITTVAAIELGLAEYDRSVVHGFVLTRDAVEDVFRTLATEPLRDRVHNPGLPPERADVIVGGCCVLVAILRRLERAALVVSDSDLLDGITAGLRARA
jgi:exopolyphosphatase/guanosine-5'-triphosphate,3'-diphosphate pyrophosphatase